MSARPEGDGAEGPDPRSADAPGKEAGAASAEGGAPSEDWATRYKYLFADFENFRRRVDRERESSSRQVRAALLRELLPLYEAFHFAFEAAARLPAGDPLRGGLESLAREWQTFLKNEGVDPVARVGEPFQAEVHEAVGELPAGEGRAEGSVGEVVQQGYRFFGGLLRPAKVIVARAPEAARAKAAGPANAAVSEERP